VFGEWRYSMIRARKILDQPVGDCRLVMMFVACWKDIHAAGFRPLLFDLAADGDDFFALCLDLDCEAERARLAKCYGR
jgi:hypothetical protein